MIALFVGWIMDFLRREPLPKFAPSGRPITSASPARTSNYAELAVVVAEAVLLIFIAVPLWAKAVDKFPDPKNSTVIQVVAQQFAWNARYAGPDGTSRQSGA